MSEGHGLSQGIQSRVTQIHLGVIKSIDWSNLTCTLELKHQPAYQPRGRLLLPSGSSGTLYPPVKVGDVVLCLVTGPNLTEMLRNKLAGIIRPVRLYDLTDVLVIPAAYCRTGEPAGRLASSPPADGEWVMAHDSGTEVRIKASGDIVFKLAADKAAYINSTTNPRRVAVHGDQAGDHTINATLQDALFVGDRP